MASTPLTREQVLEEEAYERERYGMPPLPSPEEQALQDADVEPSDFVDLASVAKMIVAGGIGFAARHFGPDIIQKAKKLVSDAWGAKSDAAEAVRKFNIDEGMRRYGDEMAEAAGPGPVRPDDITTDEFGRWIERPRKGETTFQTGEDTTEGVLQDYMSASDPARAGKLDVSDPEADVRIGEVVRDVERDYAGLDTLDKYNVDIGSPAGTQTMKDYRAMLADEAKGRAERYKDLPTSTGDIDVDDIIAESRKRRIRKDILEPSPIKDVGEVSHLDAYLKDELGTSLGQEYMDDLYKFAKRQSRSKRPISGKVYDAVRDDLMKDLNFTAMEAEEFLRDSIKIIVDSDGVESLSKQLDKSL